MKRILSCVVALCVSGLGTSTAAAQRRNLLADMQGYSQALGVTCEHCHVAPANSGLPQPKKDIARQMAAMTRDLNLKIQSATGKSPIDAVGVDCATCHRGVPIPKPLGQIIAKTLQELRTKLDRWIEQTHDQGRTPEPESRYDADMAVYQGRKPNSEVAKNIALMKQLAKEGK